MKLNGNLHLEFKVMATTAAKSVNLKLSSAVILLTSMEMSGGLTTPRFICAGHHGVINGFRWIMISRHQDIRIEGLTAVCDETFLTSALS